MKPINQELIAKHLSISRTTVSRSLANHPAISTETRSRVMQMADKLGYRISHDRAPRRTRNSRALTIGVLIGVSTENVMMATFPYVLGGIRKRAKVERVNIDISYQAPSDFYQEANREVFFRHIHAEGWRGTILIYPFPEPAVEMISKKIITVSVLETYRQAGIDIIDTDDASAIFTLVEKLHAAGHCRIGFLSRTTKSAATGRRGDSAGTPKRCSASDLNSAPNGCSISTKTRPDLATLLSLMLSRN